MKKHDLITLFGLCLASTCVAILVAFLVMASIFHSVGGPYCHGFDLQCLERQQ